MTSRLSEETGRVLGGRYRLMTPVGVGTSSRVYLAVDTQLRRRVAVKLLHEALSEDEAFLRRFRAEARAAGALSHPNILAVFDWGEDDGDDGVVPFLVTEYLGGGSLRTMLDASGHLTPSQTLVVGLDAARALTHAHQRGLVHRDVKPANLLFDDEARLRLADFGLARALAEASWTEPTGLAVGTARYASPEQAMGRRLDGRSDVYSLALVLVECVTGEVPFSGETTASTLAMRTQSDLTLGVEFGGLRSILERAGRLDPEERPEAAEFEIGLMAAAELLERPGTLPIVPSLGDGEQTSEFHLANGADGVAAIVPVPTLLEPPPPEVIGDERDAAALEDAEPDDAVPATGGAHSTSTNGTSTNGTSTNDSWTNGDVAGSDHLVRNPITVAEEHDLLSGSRPASFGPIEREAPGLPAARVAAPSEPGRGVRSLGRAERAAAKAERRVERSLAKQAAPPRRGRRVLAVLVALALLVGALGAGWWFFVRVPTHELPDLIGQQVDEATVTAEELGWTVDASTLDRADGTVFGEVLDQDPPVGEVLAEGEQVRLVVSLGPTLTEVPPLVDLSLEAATEALTAAGLTVAEPTRSFDEDVAVDAVISAAPAEGEPALDDQGRVPKGTVVRLVLSDGPQPRVVPDGLQGASVDDAVASLEALQLTVSRPESFSDDVPAGFVISVSEAPGAELPRGAEVRLEVSKGPAPIPIPDVRFDTGTAGVATLESQGFTVAGIEGSPSGMVLATDPPAGELHQRGTAVRIFTRS